MTCDVFDSQASVRNQNVTVNIHDFLLSYVELLCVCIVAGFAAMCRPAATCNEEACSTLSEVEDVTITSCVASCCSTSLCNDPGEPPMPPSRPTIAGMLYSVHTCTHLYDGTWDPAKFRIWIKLNLHYIIRSVTVRFSNPNNISQRIWHSCECLSLKYLA